MPSFLPSVLDGTEHLIRVRLNPLDGTEHLITLVKPTHKKNIGLEGGGAELSLSYVL